MNGKKNDVPLTFHITVDAQERPLSIIFLTFFPEYYDKKLYGWMRDWR